MNNSWLEPRRMAVTLKDYLDRPLDSYCSEILDEWKNLSRIDVPVLTACMYSNSYTLYCSIGAWGLQG